MKTRVLLIIVTKNGGPDRLIVIRTSELGFKCNDKITLPSIKRALLMRKLIKTTELVLAHHIIDVDLSATKVVRFEELKRILVIVFEIAYTHGAKLLEHATLRSRDEEDGD